MAHYARWIRYGDASVVHENTAPSGHEHYLFKHGLTKTPIYASWNNMMQRCNNSRHKSYKNYGARGITVCQAWHDLARFMVDMGPRPDGMTLERIDNNGNYEPSNCCWATKIDQARNRRSSRLLTYKGVTATTAEWAERLGAKRPALQKRLESGWSVEEALSRPFRRNRTKAEPLAAKLSARP